MTHQVGFSYGFTDEPVDRAFHAAGVPVIPHNITADEYLARLAKVPLAFEPGTGWRYSVAMDVQGIIVERLSGMRLRDFMMERIFAPLGMVDTDFLVPAAKRDRFAALYTLAGDTLVEMTADSDNLDYDNVAALSSGDLVLPYDQPPVLASGGGGLVSTAPDYLRFGRMLLGPGELDGRRILSPAAVALMTRSHTPRHLLTGGFGTAPHWLRPGYEYAYNGIAITNPQAAGVGLGRDTYFWDGAAGCWFWVDPTNDLVFVCMVQLLADAERLSLQFRSRNVVADILAGAAN
jgi:CubicO group peptidase (beta-lactamase class C family)